MRIGKFYGFDYMMVIGNYNDKWIELENKKRWWLECGIFEIQIFGSDVDFY